MATRWTSSALGARIAEVSPCLGTGARGLAALRGVVPTRVLAVGRVRTSAPFHFETGFPGVAGFRTNGVVL